MSQSIEESGYVYVYRRASPGDFPRSGPVNPDLFVKREGEEGLSVFLASEITPRGVLEQMIKVKETIRDGEDTIAAEQAANWLKKNPDVPALVAKGWRIVQIPKSEIERMGFTFSDTDETGHLNILGDMELFNARRLDFLELIRTGKARVLDPEECLK